MYSSAWSALESAVTEEKPLMNPFILTSFWVWVSASIAAGFDHAFFSPL